MIGAAGAGPPDEEGTSDGPRTGRIRRVAAVAERHPLLVVAALGLAFVAFQWWWISNARFVGAMDTDEGSAITTTLSFERALARGPIDLADAMLSTGNGPLVPLMALPFVAVFGRSATTPMFIQPVMVAVSAVAVAGSVRHLAGRRAALVAGTCVLGVPALITSSRTDQYSNGVGVFMSLALWALLRSDRGRRGWLLLAYGAACGAMTVSRTMAVSFLPAMGLALLVVVDLRCARTWRNLLLVALGAVGVAGLWWYRQGEYVYSYLKGYGYGDRAGLYGSTGLPDRVSSHLAYLHRDLRLLLPLGLLVAVLAFVTACRRLLTGPDRRLWLAGQRELLALWVAVAAGSAALLSSPNRGFWFATPLDTVLVAAVVAAGARLVARERHLSRSAVAASAATSVVVLLWASGAAGIRSSLALLVLALAVVAVVRGRQRCGLLLGGGALLVVVATLASSVPRQGPVDQFGANSSLRAQVSGGLEQWQHTIYDTDARLLSPQDAVRRSAAAEWAAAAVELDRQLRELEADFGDRVPGFGESILGMRPLFDGNAIGIARELGPRGVILMETVNTNGPSDDELRTSLAPTFDDGLPRVLVVVAGRAAPFPDGVGWDHAVELAEGLGWTVRSTIRLPDRGKVVIYTHPDSDPTL